MATVNEKEAAPQVEPDDVRIGMTLANGVIHATTTRSTAYGKRTVGEFFAALYRLGVSVDDELSSIEYGISQYPTGMVCVERDEQGRVEVREMRRGSL